MTRLRADLDEQAQALCRAFDAELAESCAQLVPASAEVEREGVQAAHLDRLRKWRSSNPRPMFSRIAAVISKDREFQLLGSDSNADQFVPMEWPADWANLRLRKVAGFNGAPPYMDPTGAVLEFPIFGGSRPNGGPGVHGWTILELDLAYVRERWMPDLVHTYLNPDGKLPDDVEIRTATSPPTVLYSSPSHGKADGGADISVRLNRRGRTADGARGPVDSGRWILEVRRRPGALEAIVWASRRKNLAVSLLLNVLILAAGCALAHHTRRSRQFAETQMNFVANVSHELRTPLTVIRGAAHNLQRGVVRDPGRIEQYAGLIIRHAEQLTAMVEQVLELAGARKNRLAMSRKPVALAEVLREAVAAAAPETASAHCSVQMALPHALPLVSGDSAALCRVFQNLIANAAKHGRKDGRIDIQAAVTNGSGPPMIEVKVSDGGPGIPENEASKIFTPFFRGARAQSEQIRGSGLGLSLAREIVEAHQGRISVRSHSGQGANFIVRLPVTAASPSNDIAHSAC